MSWRLREAKVRAPERGSGAEQEEEGPGRAAYCRHGDADAHVMRTRSRIELTLTPYGGDWG